MIHVIFICTGNICRSAMADWYLKKRLKDLNLEDRVKVTSAGTHTLGDEKATDYAKKAIEKYGADIKDHKSTAINESNILEADYILVMTNRHKQDVIAKYNQVAEKVHLMKEYIENQDYMDIDDPWGFNMNIYEKCAKEIVECTEEFIKRELLK